MYYFHLHDTYDLVQITHVYIYNCSEWLEES